MTYPIELIGLVGITLILVRGTIFSRFRSLWPAFLGCSQCVGMWVGGLSMIGRGGPYDAFVVGGAISVLSMLTDAVLLELLGEPER